MILLDVSQGKLAGHRGEARHLPKAQYPLCLLPEGKVVEVVPVDASPAVSRYARVVATPSPAPAVVLDPSREARVYAAAEEATRFFMNEADVHHALEKIARLLDTANIPYALVGALALGEYGYRRVTADVDLLLTREGLERFKSEQLGRGYVEKFSGSRGMRDTENRVLIDVVLAGDYPGDGKPKAVRFPDPALVAVRGERIALLPLPLLIDLKLASGLSAAHRLKDLADVLELIRSAALPEGLVSELDPSVRDKYRELWTAAQGRDDE